MDSPRHRFQRDELGNEPSGEGVSEMDFRLVSIEDELKTVSLSSAMQARDFQALRAKVESLEAKAGGGEIEKAVGRMMDHVEAQDDRIEQLFDRFQVLERHIGDLADRLDNLGDIGPIENLPSLLEQSLVTSLDDLEARLELKIESSARASDGASVPADQFDALKEEIESQIRTQSEGVDKLLENRQEEILEMIQETTASFDTDSIRSELLKEIDQIRHAVVELQEAYESVPSRAEFERVEAKASQGGGVDNSDDLTALAGELAGFKEKFVALQERVANLGDLGGGGEEWQQKLDEVMKMPVWRRQC